jgi:hypothetical protein
VIEALLEPEVMARFNAYSEAMHELTDPRRGCFRCLIVLPPCFNFILNTSGGKYIGDLNIMGYGGL